MKKYIRIGIILIVTVFIAVSCVKAKRIKFPSGRDTKESYGDGTYQILSHQELPHERTLSLRNEAYRSCLIQYVDAYQKEGSKVFITGSNTAPWDNLNDAGRYLLYAVIDINNNTATLCVVPEGPLMGKYWFSSQEKMINDGVLHLISDISEFNEEDYAVFQELQ